MSDASTTAVKPYTDSSALALWSFPVLLLLWQCWTFVGFTVDDAWISFRYAHNLAVGNGLVFNPGVHVEGFSNLSWVMLLVPFEALGLGSEGPAKLIGAACALGTLAVVRRIVLKLGADELHAMTAGLLIAAGPGFSYYSVAGLETPLYCLLITLTVWLSMAGSLARAGWVAALLVATRPEGILFASVPLVVGLLENRTRSGIMAVLPSVLTLAGLTAWRFLVFGDVVPNTFHTKVAVQGTIPQLLVGHLVEFISYTRTFGMHVQVTSFLAIVGLILLGRRAVAPLVALAMLALFVFVSGGDWMPFTRFYAPGVPLLAALASVGLYRLAERLGPAGNLRHVLLTALVVPGSVSFLDRVVDARELAQPEDPFMAAMSSHHHQRAAHRIRALSEEGDEVIAVEVGAVGYITGLRTHDALGLTDREIPRLAADGDVDGYVEYLLRRGPRFVLVLDADADPDPFVDGLRTALPKHGYRRTEVYEWSRGEVVVLWELVSPADPAATRPAPAP